MLTSYLQEKWFHATADHRCNHNNVVAWRVDGPVDTGALVAAVHALADRHEVLRTALSEDGLRQEVRPVQAPVWLADLSGSAAPQRDLDKLIVEDAEQPFLLTEAPLWRVGLVRLGRESHVLVVVVSHAVSDGWSMGVLFRDLVRLYHGIRLPELELQFGDYATWERNVSAPERESWWRDRLRILPCRAAFRMDGRVMPGGPRDRLVTLAREHGASLACVVTAGVAATLSRYVDGELVVGFMTANRDRPELQPLVGPVFDYLPLRLDPTGSLPDLVRRTRAELHAAKAHRLPLGAIENAVGGPVFDLVVEFLPWSDVAPARGFAPYPVPELTVRHSGDTGFAATATLNFIVQEEPDGLGGVVYGNALAVAPDTMGRLGREFSDMIGV